MGGGGGGGGGGGHTAGFHREGGEGGWDLSPPSQNSNMRFEYELGEGKVLSVKQFSKTRSTAKSLPTPPIFSLLHPEYIHHVVLCT